MGKLQLIAGMCFGIASALQFASYYGKPNINEADLLRSTATYIQQYEGQNPREVGDYAQITLRVAAQENPGVPEISKLEKELTSIIEEIGNSQNRSIYRPLLTHLGEKMEHISDENSRSSWTLLAGILSGVASVIGFANSF